MATDIELPSCFYLGREYDLAGKAVLDKPVLYDAADLTTHGVVVGMTGSGKTGLCIDLLEEAVIDGIPSILIDPKGDLTNLLLQFPDLEPKDFIKWLNPEDARSKGVSLEDYAKQLAEEWRKGLSEWGQSPERIQRLRDAGEFRIYTPGSEAGLPLSILQNFAAPKGCPNREALNQRIDATTTALLGLTGLTADPVKSREHILIAQLLLNAWSQGHDLDLIGLIQQIQEPPLAKIGAFDVDTFFPAKDRLKLAVALNNILAAPSFSTWITGEPLDLSILWAKSAKPRHLLFYIAHLEESQRIFFVTLLLEEVLNWTRKQGGTSNLRAIVYFDEVFGYLPPHPAHPPTKAPLMTLFKQARAFGVGVLLATQNPVDLDYKALSNAGTWFVGKLQTERDKDRLIEGLQGVAAERGTLADADHLNTVISALGNRVFLLHDVHRGQPLLFKTRHALSYLRGPLGRDQIEMLMQPIKDQLQKQQKLDKADELPEAIPVCPQCGKNRPAGAVHCPQCGTSFNTTAARQEDHPFKKDLLKNASMPGRLAMKAPGGDESPTAPEVAAGIPQFYLASIGNSTAGEKVAYQGGLVGCAEIVFTDSRRDFQLTRPYRLLSLAGSGVTLGTWQSAAVLAGEPESKPAAKAKWGPVPEAVNTAKKLKSLEKDFIAFLYGNAKVTLFENKKLGLLSTPGEDAQSFRVRCQSAAYEEATGEWEEQKAKQEQKLQQLGIRPQEESVAPAKDQSSWFDWLPFFMPAKTAHPSDALSDKDRARLQTLEAGWDKKKQEIGEKWKKIGEQFSEITLKPKKADIRITHFGVAWVPLESNSSRD